MEFDFSKEQQDLYQSVLAFCEEQLRYDVVALDAEGTFSREAWRSCADFGVLGWPVPTEYGGSGHSITTAAYMMEAFGYGCEDNSLPLPSARSYGAFRPRYSTSAALSRSTSTYPARSVETVSGPMR